MAPKNTFRFNITFSIKILCLLIFIFNKVDTGAQIKVKHLPFSLSTPLKMCPPILNNQQSDQPSDTIASDNLQSMYLTYQGGRLESIDLQTKKIIWRTELGSEIISQPVLDKPDNKTLFIATKSTSTKLTSALVRAVNTETGITKWQISTPTVKFEEVILHPSKNSLFVVSRNGTLLSIDKESGALIWVKSTNSTLISNPSFTEDQIYFSNNSNEIISVLVNNKPVIQKFITSASANIFLVLNKKDFIWSDKSGRLFFGNDLRFRAGAEITFLKLTSYGVLVASNDNFLYLISVNKQKLLWKKKLAGRVFPQPVIVEGLAIIPVVGESELSIIDLRSGKVINNLAIEEGNYFAHDFFISSNRLLTPTTKGLYYFIPTAAECL